MAVLQSRRWCGPCGRKTLHARNSFNNSVGCLLSVLTLGLFIPVWLVIGIVEAITVKWRCQACGQGRAL